MFAELIARLRRDPKQYGKKAGPLRKVRAANIRFRKREAWRAVFTLDEQTRRVHVVALGPHDRAYQDALRRI
jgi:mRNA-degrading endonuclease RelE of RelBE toxin-antitoxin system